MIVSNDQQSEMEVVPRHSDNSMPTTQAELIFVVGVSRSGTTLMRSVLNRSDAIGITRETHFMGHLLRTEGARYKFRRFGPLSSDENVRRLVDFIYSQDYHKSSGLRKVSSHWRWLIRRVDRAYFLERVLASDRSERALYKLILELFAERRDKAIAGDKTPINVRFVSELMEWFPGAHFVHMMRDPRAIYASEVRRREKKPMSTPYKQLRSFTILLKIFILVQVTLVWLESIRSAYAYRKQYPDNYLLVRFEDLVCEPADTIREVCHFVGVDFAAEMLQQSVVSDGFRAGAEGFDARAATRWQEVIEPWANKWFTLLLQKHLRAMGYDI